MTISGQSCVLLHVGAGAGVEGLLRESCLLGLPPFLTASASVASSLAFSALRLVVLRVALLSTCSSKSSGSSASLPSTFALRAAVEPRLLEAARRRSAARCRHPLPSHVHLLLRLQVVDAGVGLVTASSATSRDRWSSASATSLSAALSAVLGAADVVARARHLVVRLVEPVDGEARSFSASSSSMRDS